MQLQPNTKFDRYQLVRLLGRGGFSEVWLAKDPLTALEVAIKVYAPGQGMDDDGLSVFGKEMANVYDMHHSNLLTPTHLDQWEGMPYLILPYCAKGSCFKYIAKLSEDQVWCLLYDVASGLAYLHEREIIHQDIKPDNILIDANDKYVITDFGISTKARSTLSKSVLNAFGAGSTAYMGPERFSRTPLPVKASDIWSLGATVYEIIEGVTPFGEIGGGMQKGGAEIPEMQRAVSSELQSLVESMLAKETWNRPTAEKVMEYAKPHLNSIRNSVVNTSTSSSETSVDNRSTMRAGAKATQRFNTGSGVGQETQRSGSFSQIDEPKEPLKLTVSPSLISTVPGEGGNQNIYVFTNAKNWKLGSYAEWIHLEEKKDSHFTLRFDQNKTGNTRECSFDVSARENGEYESATIKVSQVSLPKDNTWVKWLVGIVIVIVSIFGIRACVNHQNEVERAPLKEISIESVAEESCQKSATTSKSNVTSTAVEPTTLTVSSNQLTYDAASSTKTITVSSNKSWSLQNTSSNVFSVSRSGNTLSIRCNANTSTSSRDDYFDVVTSDGAKIQRITITQKGKTESQGRTTTKRLSIDSKIVKTDYHLWKILSIELTPSKTILYGRVTPRSEETYVYTNGSEYIEDVDTGKKYYLKYSDLGTLQNPKMLYSDDPFEYTSTYPMIPDNVRAINIWTGTQYAIKNFVIR